MFWTTLCGRRVADGRWWTSWLMAPSAEWRLNDPKCAPCWPTAAAPGCSSACDRKPLTCPAVFCSSVLARIKIRNIRNCQLEPHWLPSGLGCWERRAIQTKKFEEAQQFEAALFRAVVVDVVVHSLRDRTVSSNPPSSSRGLGEIGGSSRSIAHQHL